jgi:hypothetical protein
MYKNAKIMSLEGPNGEKIYELTSCAVCGSEKWVKLKVVVSNNHAENSGNDVPKINMLRACGECGTLRLGAIME